MRHFSTSSRAHVPILRAISQPRITNTTIVSRLEISLDKWAGSLPKHEVMKTKYSAIPFVLTFAFLAFLPNMQAGGYGGPPPDGCYPGFTTAEGCNALQNLAGGAGNTGLGWYSLFFDTDGSYNTGVGAGTLVLNNAASNTAVGAAALLLNTTGTENTATGTDAMVYNDSGSGNTANGAFALFYNNSASRNSAFGNNALYYNYSAEDNTAAGYQALYNNDFSGSGMGEKNSAFGSHALWSNDDGSRNNAFGSTALHNHMSGNYNNAVGNAALYADESGESNNALGDSALSANVSGSYNTAVGDVALFTSIADDNTAIGWSAGSDVDGFGNICIGSGAYGFAGQDGVIQIGGDFSGYNACYISGISGADVNIGTAALVYVDDTGKLGTLPLAAGAKKMAVPVPRGAHRQAMLNKSEHRKIAQLQATIAELKATVARQQKETQALAEQVKEQAAQIQKVSARLEMNQPATTVVANKP